jgi:acyl-CoA synthetase (AMP-forming)/AMP-acid ligase II
MISLTLGDLYDRCVQFYGKHTAVTYGNQSFSYNQIGDQAKRLAAALQDMGLKKGDKVAFLMPNCPEYIFCEYALAKCGCVRTPLAVLLGPEDHIYMMNLTECKAVIYHTKMADRIIKMIPDLKTVAHFIQIDGEKGELPQGHHSLKKMLATYPPTPEHVDILPEDLMGIYFTGGTTGKPKGVMLSHRAWVYTILAETLDFDIGRQEVFAYAAPLTHGGGCLLLPVLLRKGRCVILDHFDPKSFLETVEKEKITSSFLVPTMIYLLLDLPERDNYNLSSLRNIIYGASAIAPDRLKQAIKTFGPIFTQLFGQTEAPMALSSLPRQEHVVTDPEREMMILSSAGRPTFHTEIKIVDENNCEVKTGKSGEVLVRSANMMDGYFKNLEATAETIRDGWLHTGDIARQDEEGFLYIVDRKKDMIISGGFNIFPREIEDVLFEHPAVRNAAVIGIPHEKWGEQVLAMVEIHTGQIVSQEELIAFVKNKKGSLVAPKKIEFRTKIPLTNLGKLDKKQIRAEYWQGKNRMVI